MYKNKNIFILGMAKSGYEVAKLLASDNNIFITSTPLKSSFPANMYKMLLASIYIPILNGKTINKI